MGVDCYTLGKNQAAGGAGSSNPKKGGRKEKERDYGEMTIDEKVRKCCRAYNSDQGCTRGSRCTWKHWCSAVKEKEGKVCWDRSHNLKTHK